MMLVDGLALGLGLALIVFAFGAVMVYDRLSTVRYLARSQLDRACDESERRAVARELLSSRRAFRLLDGEIRRFLEGVEKR